MSGVSGYDVPPMYKDKITPRQRPDPRTDSEILSELSKHIEVTSEKNIWCFWDSGLDNLPNWCRHNVLNWARICDSTWTVRLVHKVPGKPNYALDWITPAENLLPPAFVDNTMTGPYVGQHSADLLRVALIWKYGGVWLDVGVILFMDLDRLCWNRLSSPESPYEMCTAWSNQTFIGNHFIAGRKGTEFLLKWQLLFSHLWKGRTSCDGLFGHPLMHWRAGLPSDQSIALKFKWPFNVPLTTLVDYTAHISCFGRVANLQEPESGFDGKTFWHEKVLKIDALDECWRAEKLIGFNGQDLFDLLNLRKPAADADQERYQKAENLVWDLLSSASMQKVAHGKKLFATPALGTLWDEMERAGGGSGEDTLAKLLRDGSVYFEQSRREPDYIEVEKLDFVLRKGLLEE
ncbi:hypothetical protein CB0940_05064 [Cercospora beticola]|uniref:Capsule polysaccharide biosynthesis protein n=1 Tax=Cercospora beticola TaxID=122368 RepID=A0A2G5HMM8_CERBT|nr:hypothetical protein CB0940_05064 [Cercospora beticola]PIA93811.1 hypothetical protein CB0940_05064 [Cercospora beticola]WPB02362.1 hypothetical protein RHO25_006996 [Cercospora beticola]